MHDRLVEAYENTKIGGTGSIGCTVPGIEAIEQFQVVVDEVYLMERQGLITAKPPHKESQSGRHLIDHIMFVRLK
jgi:hypothetical protein